MKRLVGASLLVGVVACGGARRGAEEADKKAAARAPTIAEEADPFASLPVVNGEAVAEMYFRHYGVHPTVSTEAAPTLLFRPTADRASLAQVEAYLERGQLPPADAVRIESFVDGLTPPTEAETALSVTVQAVPAPARPGYHVLHVGMAASGTTPDAPSIVAVAVSPRPGRMEIVKRALAAVPAGVRDRWIVVQNEGRLSDPDPVAALRGGGKLDEVLARAYAELDRAGARSVVLVTDGLPDGKAPAHAAVRLAARQARAGHPLAVLAVGGADQGGGRDDGLLAALGSAGGGGYGELTDPHATWGPATLQGLQVQLTFRGDAVERYRVLGHESGLVSDASTALEGPGATLPAGDSRSILVEVKVKPGSEPLGEVSVTATGPDGATVRVSTQIERKHLMTWEGAAPATRTAVVAAVTAEKLRQGYWARRLTWRQIAGLHDQLDASARGVPRLGAIIDAAAKLDQRPDRFASAGEVETMDLDHVPVLAKE